MKLSFFLILSFLSFLSFLSWAQDSSDSFIQVTGMGKAPEGVEGAKARLMAKRTAQVVALRQLKEALILLSGLHEAEFVGIEPLMTLYQQGEESFNATELTASVTLQLTKQQILRHYVTLAKKLQMAEDAQRLLHQKNEMLESQGNSLQEKLHTVENLYQKLQEERQSRESFMRLRLEEEQKLKSALQEKEALIAQLSEENRRLHEKEEQDRNALQVTLSNAFKEKELQIRELAEELKRSSEEKMRYQEALRLKEEAQGLKKKRRTSRGRSFSAP
jgi:hypothetical protein